MQIFSMAKFIAWKSERKNAIDIIELLRKTMYFVLSVYFCLATYFKMIYIQ